MGRESLDARSSEGPDGSLDLAWGVTAIAGIIGRTERQTFHLLQTGSLPAKKVGGRWVASPSRLKSFFMEVGE